MTNATFYHFSLIFFFLFFSNCFVSLPPIKLLPLKTVERMVQSCWRKTCMGTSCLSTHRNLQHTQMHAYMRKIKETWCHLAAFLDFPSSLKIRAGRKGQGKSCSWRGTNRKAGTNSGSGIIFFIDGVNNSCKQKWFTALSHLLAGKWQGFFLSYKVDRRSKQLQGIAYRDGPLIRAWTLLRGSKEPRDKRVDVGLTTIAAHIFINHVHETTRSRPLHLSWGSTQIMHARYPFHYTSALP